MPRRPLSTYFWPVATLAACLYLIGVVAIEWQQYQWDFSVYYSAAHAARNGLDPYHLDDIQTFQKSVYFNHLDWLYPPLILRLFRPVTHLPYAVAVELWLALKVAVVAALFVVWNRGFRPIRGDGFSLAFFAFAFNAALPWDITSGNASALEALGVWVALLCWTRRRYWGFGLILAATAQMKFLPIVFLALLFFPPQGGRPQWKPLVVSMLAFLAPVAFYTARYGLWMREFLHIAATQETPAPNNASLLVFLRDLLAALGLPPSAVHLGLLALYILLAATALAYTFRVLQRYRQRLAVDATAGASIHATTGASVEGAIPIAMLAVATYTFLAPRMICYSPVLALLPAYAVLRPVFDRARGGEAAMGRKSVALPALALILAFAPLNLPPPLSHLFWMNYPRLAALGVVWYLSLLALSSSSPDSTAEV